MSYKVNAVQLLKRSGISFDIALDSSLELTDLASDSRGVTKGAAFCAYPGLSVDGRDYIEQALNAGAALILCEARDSDSIVDQLQDTQVPLVLVHDLQYRVGQIANLFFAEPSAEMQVFGVTGTNGKTSCCYLFAQAFEQLGLQAAVMGTIGYGKIGALNSATHTTPDAITVHRQLAELRDQGVTQVCMEVSSHALHQGRVAGVQFYATAFTNLSHDHLDYHGTMQAYSEAKQLLFSAFSSELAIINADDECGQAILEIANADFVVSYGDGGDVFADEIIASPEGLHLVVEANGLDFELQTPLVGLVNVPNVLLLVSALLALSTPLDDIQRIAAQLRPAPGRMQLTTSTNQPSVVVDYAHTPDALQKALISVREHCQGRLWCVFGCGGDRDAEKRPVMGDIATRFADVAVVTNDNPRTEDPQKIAEQIIAAMDADTHVILDRAAAIEYAISSAQETDWVLVAGKGHEATQTIGSQVLPFSDQQKVEQALGVAA